MFWTACANQHGSNWPPVAQLEHVTGAELWNSVYSPFLNRCSLEPFGRLAEQMCHDCEILNQLATPVFVHGTAVIQSNPLLITPTWSHLQDDLVEAVQQFIQHLRNCVLSCEQIGFHSVIGDLMYGICTRLCKEVERLKTSYNYSIVPIDDNYTDVNQVDDAFVSVSNMLIRSVLSTMEVLYSADQPTRSGPTQVDYLLHFSRAATEASRLLKTQVTRQLARCNASLQPDGTIASQADCKLTARLRLARCILPFLDQLSNCVQVRVAQFWNWLDSWTSLGEAMLRITGQLLTDGFCRPAGLIPGEGSGEEGDSSGSGGGGGADAQSSSTNPDGSQTGATSLTAQGVNAANAKDVSDQIESEEQVEGLIQDRDNEQPSDKSDNADRDNSQNQGIEMPDDNFSGALEDALTVPDTDDQEEENTEQLENRMHDGDDLGGGSDDLSKEMWASEDEDDNKDQADRDKKPLAKETGGVEDTTTTTDGGKPDLVDDKPVQQKTKEQMESDKEDSQVDEAQEREDTVPNEAKRSTPTKQTTGKHKQTVAGTDANPDEQMPEQFEMTDSSPERQDEQQRAETERMHMDEQQEMIDSDDADLADLPEDVMDLEDSKQLDEGNEAGKFPLHSTLSDSLPLLELSFF